MIAGEGMMEVRNRFKPMKKLEWLSYDGSPDPLHLTVDPSESAAVLKRRIQDHLDVEPNDHRLAYSNDLLEDPITLESYEIQEKIEIYLHLLKPKEEEK